MIKVSVVDDLINGSLLDLPVEKIGFEESLGRILKEKIVADREFPPFDRVMMDGIAIKFSEWDAGRREYPVTGLQAAGDPIQTLAEPTACLEVMTGAILPAGADTVIKYEDLNIEAGTARVNPDLGVRNRQHIHPQGADRQSGEVLININTVMSPAEVAILATVGKSEVLVATQPRIAVIATGDELIDVSETPLQHQIRKSNVYELKAGLTEQGISADIFHFIDDKEQLLTGLKQLLETYDVLVLSGGVSMGKLDYVPEILAELGVEKLFHKVSQRPGKPFWFGRHQGGVVFALPGNPVSTYVGLKRYVIPFIWRTAGVEPRVMRARLAADFTFKPDLTYFLQVTLKFNDEGQLMATPAPGQGSGDLANLVNSEAFIELPQGENIYKAGEVFTCYPFR